LGAGGLAGSGIGVARVTWVLAGLGFGPGRWRAGASGLMGEVTATTEQAMKIFRLLILTYDVRNLAEICQISEVIIL
jgi:hypothetical protein